MSIGRWRPLPNCYFFGLFFIFSQTFVFAELPSARKKALDKPSFADKRVAECCLPSVIVPLQVSGTLGKQSESGSARPICIDSEVQIKKRYVPFLRKPLEASCSVQDPALFALCYFVDLTEPPCSK